MNGPLYKIPYKNIKCFALEQSVFQTKCLRSLFKILLRVLTARKKYKSPVHLVLNLESLHLILSLYFFSKMQKKLQVVVFEKNYNNRIKPERIYNSHYSNGIPATPSMFTSQCCKHCRKYVRAMSFSKSKWTGIKHEKGCYIFFYMISKSHLVEERTRSCLMMLHDSNEEKITQGSIRRPAARPARQPRPTTGWAARPGVWG